MKTIYYVKIVGEGITKEQHDIIMKAYFSALVKGGSGKLMHSSCEEVSK